MDSQHPRPPHQRPPHPHLHNILTLPLPPQHVPQRTANSTPVSSPGLFSPTHARPTMSFPLSQPGSETATPGGSVSSPYLHPLQGHLQSHLQGHKVRETHKANVEHDYATGRKLINNYEIIEELGRGVHGKVKLARNVENGEFVAIKIIPRFSKKRRLGKVTAMSTQDKSKREIAILKKIRHPNVVALLEIIDDPELKKIYMVLEHVELGEVVWRKKGLPHICEYERRRIEREMRGGTKPSPDEERFERLLLQRQAAKDAERARIRAKAQRPATDYWSLEYGPADDEELDCRVGSLGRDDTGLSAMRPTFSNSSSLAGSRATSRAPSRTHSTKSLSMKPAEALLSDAGLTSAPKDGDLDTPGALPIKGSTMAALEGTMYGAYLEDPSTRGRSPSMADSLTSHLSAFDFNRVHDPYVDDFSYVPCFTLEQAKNTFRDTVLGLEYLHYEGVVHRDIKPANLLWTKDKRAKIADFGVSYFGRPVRDGEPDDTISESEAKDFDNDLELAKTVGTPAFFAPELCATDLYDAPPGKQQLKVTEQIDVWSLGVTLYCLVFARLPFLAEDEWQMFKKIANEEVYIPTRRLRPVDPATKPSEKSLYTRVNNPPYRDDDELAYEDIDGDLQDLLRKMLTKNPDKRIRLRDVKRHPWVMNDLHDKVAWIDDTDPSRRTSGRKITVDEKDVARAVVPLNIFERARSVVKKAVGKVMHPRGERTDSVSSRRRAASSAASSAGDSPITGLITPHLRDSRRRSLRPDEYFSSTQQTANHPLTHSVLASPQEGPQRSDTLSSSPPHQSSSSSSRRPLEWLTTATARDEQLSGPSPVSPQRALPRHGHARSLTNTFLSLTAAPLQTQTMPPTPLFDGPLNDPSDALRKARDTKPTPDELGRARSVDRGLFASDDKRAEARVSLSTAVAPGNVHFTPQFPPRFPTRSMQLVMGGGHEHAPSSTVPSTPSGLSGYQNGPFKSDPNMHNKQRALVELEERPMTAHRAETFGQARPSSQHALQKPGTPEPAHVPCPPSPDEDGCPRMPLSRGETIVTGKSSSTTSVGALATPLTSPSESASPIYAVAGINNNNDHINRSNHHGNIDLHTGGEITKEVADRMLAFQSDPSLPALLSSTSSVSADLEGEFLGNPGVVGVGAGGPGDGTGRPSVMNTTDSLTPPAFAKEPGSGGFPLEAQDALAVAEAEGAVRVRLDGSCDTGPAGNTPGVGVGVGVGAVPGKPVGSHHHHNHHNQHHHLHLRRGSRSHVHDEEEDDDSDSDEGLTMAKRKKPTAAAAAENGAAGVASAPAPAPAHSIGRLVGIARRRDTNASVGSTETAKKVAVVDDE